MDVIYAALKEEIVKKEIYVVDCPTHIRFGDPMYFERFEGQKLDRLAVNCKVPKNFVDGSSCRNNRLRTCREKCWIP